MPKIRINVQPDVTDDSLERDEDASEDLTVAQDSPKQPMIQINLLQFDATQNVKEDISEFDSTTKDVASNDFDLNEILNSVDSMQTLLTPPTKSPFTQP